MPTFVKETQLVCRGGPNLGQHSWLERGAISNDLIGVNASGVQLLEKLFNLDGIHISLHQLVADQAIAIGCRRINREQEGELALIDFIDTQDARECLHNPGLVIGREVKASTIGPAPLPNTRLTRAHPEIAGEAFGHAAHGHPILIDGGDSRGDDPIGVSGIGAEEGRLGAEVMLARGTEMHADRNKQQGGTIKIEINGDTLGGSETRSWLLAAVTREGRQQVRHLTHLTDRVIEGQWRETESFLIGVVQIFYHAGIALASRQTSITQSPAMPLIVPEGGLFAAVYGSLHVAVPPLAVLR
jgi:hypothetical protein